MVRVYGPRTSIYRVSLKGVELSLEAHGEVGGMVLDQFAMAELGGYFVVATSSDEGGNSVYVLDMDLDVVGVLKGLAKGERIYAARFIGDLLFLVTYRRVDPVFAIDLSDPSKPMVLGFLELPGYSEYLHWLGDGWLLGVGVDERGFVKASLFNASNPAKLNEACSIRLEAT